MDYEPAESGNQHRQHVPHGLVTRSWLSGGILHGMSCRAQAARRARMIGGRRALAGELWAYKESWPKRRPDANEQLVAQEQQRKWARRKTPFSARRTARNAVASSFGAPTRQMTSVFHLPKWQLSAAERLQHSIDKNPHYPFKQMGPKSVCRRTEIHRAWRPTGSRPAHASRLFPPLQHSDSLSATNTSTSSS